MNASLPSSILSADSNRHNDDGVTFSEEHNLVDKPFGHNDPGGSTRHPAVALPPAEDGRRVSVLTMASFFSDDSSSNDSALLLEQEDSYSNFSAVVDDFYVSAWNGAGDEFRGGFDVEDSSLQNLLENNEEETLPAAPQRQVLHDIDGNILIDSKGNLLIDISALLSEPSKLFFNEVESNSNRAGGVQDDNDDQYSAWAQDSIKVTLKRRRQQEQVARLDVDDEPAAVERHHK